MLKKIEREQPKTLKYLLFYQLLIHKGIFNGVKGYTNFIHTEQAVEGFFYPKN